MDSKAENRFLKRKNLLDLEYQTYLNIFNILAISLITIAITFSVAWLTEKIDFEILKFVLFLDAAVGIVVVGLFFNKTDGLKKKINRLRLS